MKKKISFLVFAVVFSCLISYSQNSIVSGVVKDWSNAPLQFANVSLDGSLDGTSTDKDGLFSFETSFKGEVVLRISMVGYETYLYSADVCNLQNVNIQLKAQKKTLNEVVISASSFHLLGGNKLEQRNAVDLVTVAGSEGDLFKSLSFLPGVQNAGTDGKLLVRGGASRESQTFIDEMHVLNAYTSMPANVSSRGRYSPFLFEGVSFSLGGYSAEYSQGLSSILPLSTKNKSPYSKLGASIIAPFQTSAGGTQSWHRGSASFNVDYGNMDLYNKIFSPNDKTIEKPYQTLSAQNQLRFETGKNSYLKTYFAYDYTNFGQLISEPFEDNNRSLRFGENNIYLNSTFRSKLKSGENIFAGVAYSYNKQDVDNGRVDNDRVRIKNSEMHIKMKADKRFSNLYKLGVGAESYLRNYDLMYADTSVYNGNINHHISGLYVSNDFILTPDLYFNASGRLEYTSLNNRWNILPRLALNYNFKNITFSGAYGRYQQLAENDYLLYNEHLSTENCQHYIFSASTELANRVYRVELYHKTYDNLTTFDANNIYNSFGYGFSNGIDVFLQDKNFMKYWDYTITYSYNNSKRLYLDYEKMITPPYSTHHNASIMLKYNLLKYKTILGVTSKYASGTVSYNTNNNYEKNITGFYNNIDLCLTYLANSKLIIYASASNILNRNNVYGYKYSKMPNSSGQFDRLPIHSQMNQFFFVGFFLTLGKNSAYDASTF